MKTLIERSESLLISSDENEGAINVNSLGNRFQLNLGGDGIKIPKTAEEVQLQCQEALVWNVIPNIKAGVNDKFSIKCTNGDGIVVNHLLTIPQGVYTLQSLYEMIILLLKNENGYDQTGEPPFSLEASNATQKTILSLNFANVEIDFTIQNSLAETLGFEPRVVVVIPNQNGTTVLPQVFLGDKIAKFDLVQYLLLHTDLTDNGIKYNGRRDSIISRIFLNNDIGSQCINEPINPPIVSCNNLKGSTKSNISVWITDQNGNDVNMLEEPFSARLLLTWKEPLHEHHHSNGKYTSYF